MERLQALRKEAFAHPSAGIPYSGPCNLRPTSLVEGRPPKECAPQLRGGGAAVPPGCAADAGGAHWGALQGLPCGALGVLGGPLVKP